MGKIGRKWEFLYHLVGVNLDNYLHKQTGSYLGKGERAYPMTKQFITRYLSKVFKSGMHNPGVHEESFIGADTFKGINFRLSASICNVWFLNLSVWEYICNRGFKCHDNHFHKIILFSILLKEILLSHLQFHKDAISQTKQNWRKPNKQTIQNISDRELSLNDDTSATLCGLYGFVSFLIFCRNVFLFRTTCALEIPRHTHTHTSY